MKKIIYLLAAPVIVIVAIVAVKNIGKSQDANERTVEKATPTQGLMSDKERVSRMKKLIAEKGGLPLDLALKNAKTEEQRERLKSKLSYQSETKAEAVMNAENRLRQIEDSLDAAEDGAEKEKLERQKEALLQIIANLNGE